MAKSKNRKIDKTTASKQPSVTSASTVPDIDGATSIADEYNYVRKDLRHLAVISIVLFVVMLGVGYFI